MMNSNGLWLKSDAIFDGQEIKTGYLAKFDDGHISQMVPNSDMIEDAPIVRLPCIIAPGFVDLQVNGGGGVLLNQDPSAHAMLKILNAHRQFGTVAIMPTVITDGPKILAKAVDAAIKVKGTRGLLGLHIEGPHIAVERRGAHDKKFVRAFAQSTLAHVEKLRSFDIPVIITLAPEVVDGATISRLVKTGAIVSLGHSNANVAQTQEALRQGALSFTHMFNAMPPMMSREPGIVAAAINSDAYTGIIGDGLHVDDEMIKLALRARPVPDRVFIVSDSMSTIGGPDQFDLYGRRVYLQNGRLINSEGSLAGAHITMAQTVQRFVAKLGVQPAEALKMATSVPANLIGTTQMGQVHNRPVADLIALDNQFAYLNNLEDYLAAHMS